MRRTAALVLTSFVVAFARPVLAQEDSSPVCEAVTSVRCLPGRTAPPPAPVPEPLPPVADPCGACAEPPIAAPPIQTLPPSLDWRLSYDQHGRPLNERIKRVPIGGVWVPGLVLWIGTYLGTAIGGARDDRSYAAIPLFGGFGASVVGAWDGDAGRTAGYAMGSLMQIGGLVMFVAGLVGRKQIERMPVQLSTFGLNGGGGAGVSGRF